MKTPNRWLVLAIVSSALFLITVDMTVLYTALPRLTHDLAATASEKLWIINAYALIVAGLLPGCGTLGDRVGHRKMLAAGLATFGSASLLAAFAPSAALLIAARALLGVGAAMMMPATLSIIRITFTDKHDRSLALGIWGAIASGGAALGPVIGGILLEYFHWGSVFLINVPVVAIALIAALTILPSAESLSDRRWDPVASLQIMIGLIALAFAIKEISRPEPSYGLALLAALLGSASLAIFLRGQRRSAEPLLELSFFNDRVFTMGAVVAVVTSVIMVGVELAFSQRLQLVLGFTPLQAAFFILPIPLAAFVGGPLAGFLLPKLGTERIMWVTLLLTGGGLAGLLAAHGSGGVMQGTSLAAMGLGLGAAMAAASNAIMSRAPAHRAGMAASVEEVSYELGGAIGIAVFGSILSAVYSATLALPGELSTLSAAYDSLDAALLASETLKPETATMLTAYARTAFDKAFVTVVIIAGLIATATAAFCFSSSKR